MCSTKFKTIKAGYTITLETSEHHGHNPLVEIVDGLTVNKYRLIAKLLRIAKEQYDSDAVIEQFYSAWFRCMYENLPLLNDIEKQYLNRYAHDLPRFGQEVYTKTLNNFSLKCKQFGFRKIKSAVVTFVPHEVKFSVVEEI